MVEIYLSEVSQIKEQHAIWIHWFKIYTTSMNLDKISLIGYMSKSTTENKRTQFCINFKCFFHKCNSRIKNNLLIRYILFRVLDGVIRRLTSNMILVSSIIYYLMLLNRAAKIFLRPRGWEIYSRVPSKIMCFVNSVM